jgi:DNA-binding NtrC family response regulator
MATLLILEDNTTWKELLSEALAPMHRLTFCRDSTDATEHVRKRVYDVCILDLQEQQEGKISFVQRLINEAPSTRIVITSQTERAELIVQLLRVGVFDFICKPYPADRIKSAISHALENRTLKNEIDYLRRQQDIIYDYDRIIAVSPAMLKIISEIKKLANTDSMILITGETGTGKSILSGTIHFNSSRREKPFVKINCANIPETLLESELFGHAKGSFTGANKTRIGRLEQANGGTVFLDEIGELSPALQAKLLRVLEDKSFERLGENRTIHSDIRIIAATNRNLEEQVAARTFREDLYYRINVLRVHLPPLRERPECIEPLAHCLLQKICRSVKKRMDGFSPEIITLFTDYRWPGNIRELSNVIERAVILEEGLTIQRESLSLPEEPRPQQSRNGESGNQALLLDDNEKNLIRKALGESLWIQKDAAARLGITPRILNYKIKKYGITHAKWRKNK